MAAFRHLPVLLALILLLPLPACNKQPAAASPDAAASSTPPAPHIAPNPARQVRGFTIEVNDPAGTKAYLKAIDDLAAMGCTAIDFVIEARVDNVHSPTVAMKWQNLPRAADLERIFRHARDKGFFTMVMPIVLIEHAGPDDWRGVIQPAGGTPDDWHTWFDSYLIYMRLVSDLAQKCDVNLLCVGSELLSTESFRAEWLRTIADVRQHFHGKLTYSANWDHFHVPTFWDHLDYIGMNIYYQLADHTGVPLDQLNTRWDPIKKDIFAFIAQQKKPFIFTEVGWHNLANTLCQPWFNGSNEPIDLIEQKHGFQSFVDTWGHVPADQLMGVFVWEWLPGADGSKTRGIFSLQNTPALPIVQSWMTAPQ